MVTNGRIVGNAFKVRPRKLRLYRVSSRDVGDVSALMPRKSKEEEFDLSEVELKSVMTPRMWAFIIVFSVVMSSVGVVTSPFAPTWTWSILFGTATGPIVVLFIAILLGAAAPSIKKIVSPQKLAVLYTAAGMSLAFAWSMVPYGILHNSALTHMVTFPPYTDYISWVFGPKDVEVVRQLTTGGAATPWGAWAPWLGFWIVYSIVWTAFWVGWIAILAERWIEVERLPFAFAATGTEQISYLSPPPDADKTVLRTKLKLFLVGWVLGLLVILPIGLHYLVPWIPDPYGFSAPPFINWYFGVLVLDTISPINNLIPVWWAMSLNPMHFALFYLFPVKTLFSIWFFDVFGIKLPSQVAYWLGYFPAGVRGVGAMNGPPFKWGTVQVGMFAGMVLIWFALNAKWFVSTMKLKRTPEDAKRALPNSVAWITIAISTIALIAMLVSAGSFVTSAIMIILVMLLVHLGGVRVLGYCGVVGTAYMFVNDCDQLPIYWRWYYGPNMTLQTVNYEYVTSMMMSNRFTAEIMGENNTQFGMVIQIPLSYKVAFDTNTHPMDITKVILVAAIISAVIGFPTAVWFDYTFGTATTPMGMYDAWWIWHFPNLTTLYNSPGPDPVLGHVIAGALITIVFGFLGMRYIWWPLEPAGVALSVNLGSGVWITPALTMWIAKILVLRIGGTKLSDNYVVPLCVGFIVGYWFLMFISGLMGMVRFFMPA